MIEFKLQFSKTNLTHFYSCSISVSDGNGFKNVHVAIEQHIRKSNDVNRIEMDTNSSLIANEANKMKQKHQNSANSNGNDDKIESTENADSKDNLQQNMAFDALENTKLAVAQFTAAALSKGVNESSVKDLTMLQSALFTLQHQQVFQMQLIEQLQFQLAKTNARKEKTWKNPQIKCTKNDEATDEPPNYIVATEDESDFKLNSIEW